MLLNEVTKYIKACIIVEFNVWVVIYVCGNEYIFDVESNYCTRVSMYREDLKLHFSIPLTLSHP